MATDDKTKQEMESGFENAVRIVKTRFSEFEHKIFVPCLESSRKFADRRPLAATLISIFGMLSFLPVVSFLGFAILVFAAFLFVGLGGAFIASSVLIVGAAGVLVFILGTLLLASIFLTAAVVALFFAFRLAQHLVLRNGVKLGFESWARETRSKLRWLPVEPNRALVINNDPVEKETNTPSGSDEWHPVTGEKGEKN